MPLQRSVKQAMLTHSNEKIKQSLYTSKKMKN